MGLAFTYRRGCTDADLRELCDSFAPVELAGWSEGLRRAVRGVVAAEAAVCRAYVARLGSRLAGICFIRDLPGRREMAFHKTRLLAEGHRIGYARALPRLFADLARLEDEAGRGGTPLTFRVPERDARSRAWFVAACGCTATPDGMAPPGPEGHGTSTTGGD